MKISSIKSLLHSSQATRSVLSAHIISAVLSFCSVAFAAGLKVQDGKKAYFTRIITAENVKGVNITLSKDILQDNCNKYGMSVRVALVTGSGDGLNDAYFVDVKLTQTKKNCPDKGINQTAYSDPIPLGTITNEEVKKKVEITVIFPEGFELDVKPIR